jgi:Raf kinase inhibitor-like YbhB/YbcL family protein
MAGFVLTSPSFPEGGAIPVKHSCDGQDLSPALNWEGAPAGTSAFALIVEDPDAGGFIHWVAYNIRGDTRGLAEGVPSAGPPPQGQNGMGRTGYGGPCPPSGTHHYRFTLYALSKSLSLQGTPTAGDLRAALTAAVPLGQTTLVGTYTRQK